MTGLDCNILVQLAFSDHPVHARTVATLAAQIVRDPRLAVPSLILPEFLHIVTDPRRFSPPLTMDQACEWLEQFLASSNVAILYDCQQSSFLALLWLRKFHLGRKRIIDTHIAAVLHNGAVRRFLTSNARDFSIFGVFDLVAP